MNRLLLLLTILLFTGYACKTPQKSAADLPVNKETHRYTEEEKDHLRQRSYNPDVNRKPTQQEIFQIENLTRKKADLLCRKKQMDRMISKGENPDPVELKNIDEALNETDKSLEILLQNPGAREHYDEIFRDAMKGCDL